MKKVLKNKEENLKLTTLGFTLVELLGVIIVLGLIALIVYPVITQTIKKQEQKSFKASMEGIIRTIEADYGDDEYTAPRVYYYDHGKLILESVSNIERNENVKINGKIDASGYIYVDDDGNIILDYLCNKKYCGYNTITDSVVIVEPNTGNQDAPLITLNGEETVYVNLNDKYIEKGASAKTKSGQDLTDNIVTTIQKNQEKVERIDTSVAGSYKIVYSVTYKGKTVTVTRNVYVVGLSPVIMFSPEANGLYQKSIDVAITVTPGMGQTVQNFTYQLNGGEEVTVDGVRETIALNQSGEYTITVKVTDTDGHQSTKTSGKYKIDNIAPELVVSPSAVTLKITEVVGYDLMTGISGTDNSGISPTITKTGTLEAVLGDYTITYTATDGAGNSVTKNRTITVVEADGPILNFSSIETNGVVEPMEVIATATDTSNLSSFTYEVLKDGTSLGVLNGTITGNSGRASINLNETGMYTIKLSATDIYGNTNTLSSGIYQILKFTNSNCFVYTKTDTDVTITDYECVSGNKKGLEVITDVVIPKTIEGVKVTVIGYDAFYDSGLTSVVIPNSVTSIGSGAFYSNQLTSVTIPNSVTSIERSAFSDNLLTSLVIPSSVTSLGYMVFNDNQLPDSEAFIYARKSDGSIDNTVVVSYGGAKKDNVVIQSGVTRIDYYAFSNVHLRSVTIPNSVTYIGRMAFASNQLTSVSIGNGVTEIDEWAFKGNQLTSVVIPESVRHIAEGAFESNQLTSVTIKGKSSSSDFITYDPSWGWASGYSDSNIIWNG